MLFDLRGRGRRRTVQAIYLGLAILIGLGLIGFGVGGGLGGGGILTAFEKERSNNPTFNSDVTAAQKRIRLHPKEAAAWAALIEAKLHQASDGTYYDQATGKYTSQGQELLHQISEEWNEYLALTKNPSPRLAHLMVGVYDEEALNQPASAVEALQILVAAEPPSESLYASLAEAAFKAQNTRQGDLAMQKAIGLAPKTERAQLKRALEAIKTKSQSSSTTAGSSTGTVVTATATASANK